MSINVYKQNLLLIDKCTKEIEIVVATVRFLFLGVGGGDRWQKTCVMIDLDYLLDGIL